MASVIESRAWTASSRFPPVAGGDRPNPHIEVGQLRDNDPVLGQGPMFRPVALAPIARPAWCPSTTAISMSRGW